MPAHRNPARNLACLLLACLTLMIFSGTAGACRMYAAIGSNLPNGMLYNNLVSDPNSLYYLAPYNDDGWGIGYYPHFGDFPTIVRGLEPANSGDNFTNAVNAINTSEPQITLVHIRYGSSGCFNVPDPHPFYRDKVGKRWLFEHNGGVDKTRMTDLIGTTYLTANPPNGSDIPACASGVVDSELYFLFVMKKIEEYGWNVVNGSTAAINAMIAAGETGAINFILSNGEKIWAFRKGNTLSYLDASADPVNGYTAVASQPPTATQGSWVTMTDNQLIVLAPGASPLIISNVRNFCPGDISGGDKQVNTSDLAILAGNFGLSGSGDLDFDGDVDGADVAAMVAAYGKACP
jgi:predicted glutamine amidotransferase